MGLCNKCMKNILEVYNFQAKLVKVEPYRAPVWDSENKRLIYDYPPHVCESDRQAESSKTDEDKT